MATALAVSALLILIVAATRLIHRLDVQHAERITLHGYGSLPSEHGLPGQAAGQLPPRGFVARPAVVRPRRDNRDGGRGRLRPRRRSTREEYEGGAVPPAGVSE